MLDYCVISMFVDLVFICGTGACNVVLFVGLLCLGHTDCRGGFYR